ncbi:MAG: copper chaperone PCu(A)C [Guyparkeria sp.]
MMKMTHFAGARFTALLMGGSLLASTAAAQAAELDVHNAWVALAPPGAHATAAFMELHNPGDEAVDVVSADAEGFKAVELHESINQDGMHRMIEQDRITVPAGETVVLAPGGYHVMLIGPERSLTEGEMVVIDLGLGDGSRLEVSAPVTPRGKAMGGQHNGMH